MATSVTITDGYIHVICRDKPAYETHIKHQTLMFQGPGRYDAATRTAFLEYRKQLIPIPLLGEVHVEDLRD